MASIEGPTDGDSFPAVNAARELNLGVPEEFPVDPISSDVESARIKELKEAAEAKARAAEAKDAGKRSCRPSNAPTSTLAVAALIAAAVGVALFAYKKSKRM